MKLVAVAAAGPEETTGAFDHAPGLSLDTHRYDDARKMLDSERLDVVQVSGRNDRIPAWSRICLERGLPVMAEKPLAMDLPTLEGLFHAAQKTRAALVPMHTMRGVPALAAVRQAVAAGAIGDPLVSFSQKTYQLGYEPPRTLSQQRTHFPASLPGSASTHSTGCTGSWATCSRRYRGEKERRPDPNFTACASQAAFVLTMKNGGVASRHARLPPPGRRAHACGRAPTHCRYPRGHRDRPGRAQGDADHPKPIRRACCRCQRQPIFSPSSRGPCAATGRHPLELHEACRITEIAIKAQLAADTRTVVSLDGSPYKTA